MEVKQESFGGCHMPPTEVQPTKIEHITVYPLVNGNFLSKYYNSANARGEGGNDVH